MNPLDDITATLRNRLLVLIEQVERDRTAITSIQHAEGLEVYTRLFDSLTVTLHNLEESAAAAKSGGES